MELSEVEKPNYIKKFVFSGADSLNKHIRQADCGTVLVPKKY